MASQTTPDPNPERKRLDEEAQREKNWKRWGPYLSERQWGTVREDYSADGDAWNAFPHQHARSRAYRWGEDGLLGITDRECRLCFGLALWNGQDTILKERLFGLTGPEGNHGEDCKELYYYLHATPTYSYIQSLYKYPQAPFPYTQLRQEASRRGLQDLEYEILDTGCFDQGRYWDIFAEYAKNGPNDILIKITVANRGPEPATLHLLPTLWFRNTWIWGCEHEGCTPKPRIVSEGKHQLVTQHATLDDMHFWFEGEPTLLFTENETNQEKLYAVANDSPFVKDAFHEYIVQGRKEVVNPHNRGTKAACHYRLDLEPGASQVLKFRLASAKESSTTPFDSSFASIFAQRMDEMDTFYQDIAGNKLKDAEQTVLRQAYAGLLHTKQFYHYSVKDWLNGDKNQIAPPEERKSGRNHEWTHVFNRDILSMPDKWEYPWYAAWDLAFHMIPFSKIDPTFAKEQLILMLREWYMHPNGQIPAYEYNFSDVNPPVHAWAVWRIYKMTAPKGQRDTDFLAQCFHKLLINFTWWVNRKDPHGKNLFAGGFLGLDNIGAFDRSKPLPAGVCLEQADGTAWMAFYCSTMLSMAFELAAHDAAYEGVASKFFEHFVSIAEAMNTLEGKGLWDDNDGFYYDQLRVGTHSHIPMAIRSMVGLLPICAVEILQGDVIDRLPRFKKRMQWFMEHNCVFSSTISCMEHCEDSDKILLTITPIDRLKRILTYLFDENEFLSPYGIRSLSKFHEKHPYILQYNGQHHEVGYVPAESNSWMFGGNSNWRGPVWFPVNFLIVEALEVYHHYYGDSLKVEFPTGSGNTCTLGHIATRIRDRLIALFLPNEQGERPIHQLHADTYQDPHFKQLVLFYEYFHGDNGRGVGASHQTGWTGLVAKLLENKSCR